MLPLAPNKAYKIQVTFPESAAAVYEITAGSKAEKTVEQMKQKYPAFRRIVVYDPDTGDAVAMIKH